LTGDTGGQTLSTLQKSQNLTRKIPQADTMNPSTAWPQKTTIRVGLKPIYVIGQRYA
jgi:hypothetical protein